MTIAQFDLRSLPASFYLDPYPTYRALRDHDPIFECPDGSFFLSRHPDLVEVYRDTRVFSSDKKLEFGAKYGSSPLLEHHTTSLVFNDPPLHTRVRRLLVGAMTPKAIASMEPSLIALVDGLLDQLEDAKSSVDLIEQFASPIPIEVIGNLLNVPREERGPLRDWSLAILGALEPTLTPEQEKAGNDAVVAFSAYLRDLVGERRRNPGDPSTDVLTRLIEGESEGERLSEDELLHNCIFILNAGHETTTNLIGNGLNILSDFRDQRERLLADDGLIETAIEEFLRFESSNQLGNRITTSEIELGGKKLPEKSRLTLGIGAANRDPAVFPDPDRVDVGRSPNKHLAFASGPHTCVGFSLARMEGRIAIGRFLKRFPDYDLNGAPMRDQRARFRSLVSLPADLNG